MNEYKKTLLIDLDGVLNQYVGDFDKDFIPAPKERAKYFLEKLSNKFQLMLFTTRNKLLASKWLIKHDLDKYFVDITDIKKLSWLIVDDRCLRFEGDYDKLVEQIISFTPWYKNNSDNL